MCLIDSFSLDFNFRSYNPSAIAASTFLIVYTFFFQEEKTENVTNISAFCCHTYLEKMSGYSIDVLQNCCNSLYKYTPLTSVSSKYTLDLKMNDVYLKQVHNKHALKFQSDIELSRKKTNTKKKT